MSQFLKPSWIGSSGAKESTSVCACVASPRPAINGTEISNPAAFAAFSTPTFPASTITSATLAENFCAIASSCVSTRDKRSGSLPAHFFCGSNLMRAPFAPPRRSEPRNVRALSHAVETKSETDKSVAEIAAFTSDTEYLALPAGIGSCQIKSSAGTSGPKYRTFGPRSRCVNLNHARANTSLK